MELKQEREQDTTGSSSSDSYHYEVPGISAHRSQSDQSPEELSGYQSSDPSSGATGSDKTPGSSDPSGGSGTSGSHTTSSSKRTTGTSSVTWHENVDGASETSASRRNDSCLDGEESNKTSDSSSNRSSLRRFKEGSKVFVGFIEDAEGLQPSDDMLPPMSWEEKCEIIEELCSALQKRLERLKNDKGGVVDHLQNYIDMAKHTIGMARKDRVEMHRNVIQFSELLNKSKKPYAEDMLRYLHGRIVEKRHIKEKLEQRNRRLEKLVTNATTQLDHKLDVKDLLHDSDIMELQNLNNDLAQQLATRTELLNKARTRSRRTVKLGKQLGEDLKNKIHVNESMKQNLTDRSPLIQKFQELISSETQESEKLNLELLGYIKGEDMRPTVIEYMKLRQRAKDLRKELYKWFAKVEIAELTHSELTKHLSAATAEAGSAGNKTTLVGNVWYGYPQ